MSRITTIGSELATENESIAELPLVGGRTLAVICNDAGEEIQLCAPDGEVEVRIVVTENGPVLRMRAARLEVDGAEDVNFSCQRFAVHTTEATHLTTEGQLRLRSDEQVLIRAKEELDLKGRPVRTNVKDGLFYDDYIKPVNGPNWGSAFEGVAIPECVPGEVPPVEPGAEQGGTDAIP
jgi:hypothetical protein